MKLNPFSGRRYHVRCKQCEARRVFKRSVDDYIRLPACHYCGNHTWRKVKKTKTEVCHCDGYWFPHRKASLYCTFNPNYEHRDDKPYTLY